MTGDCSDLRFQTSLSQFAYIPLSISLLDEKEDRHGGIQHITQFFLEQSGYCYAIN